MLISERWKRRPLAPKEKVTVFVVCLVLLYAAVIGANVNDLRGYVLFQIKNPDAREVLNN